MIEKIDDSIDGSQYLRDSLKSKVNELIDAVNLLQATCMTSQGSVGVLRTGNPEIVGSNPIPGNIKDPKLAESVNLMDTYIAAIKPYERCPYQEWDHIKQVLTEKGLI